ncbi:MAG: hypothetical protein A2508_03570 [Candidatus Lambdaproteobacteria bacterium RIFOXYD12_FULL_49_8]|uniref:Nudix hydrolase domain-containing protein n=1 Tax=Candidatus Lambdaproteobacteria bacterium RIFOXYD2_FULL_50_16 TaxID=1817772 RepID=A0A1F6GD51_9PROT|nr:MAG: hypothetical protein A2527_11985 [Candidatus Lambdaproteobacteria bacterium RIFOXYD2_FULL_50_16]OGG96264.1 MAG: hypothetical protein A2508_03570 [Candidatus Lambdaproteobacteria bacterium RIFOXYD12_FULL_49_8]
MEKTVAAVAVIRSPEGKTLWQLRDGDKPIDYPGHWGLFGGGLKPGEGQQNAMMRELKEELELVPSILWKLADFEHPKWLLNCFLIEMKIDLGALILHEGADLGLFTDEEVLSGSLTSPKFQTSHPVCPPLLELFQKVAQNQFLRFSGAVALSQT